MLSPINLIESIPISPAPLSPASVLILGKAHLKDKALNGISIEGEDLVRIIQCK